MRLKRRGDSRGIPVAEKDMRAIARRVFEKLHMIRLVQAVRYGIEREICRVRYACVLRRIRRRVLDGKKVRVVFFSDNTAKWKCQSVYDAMVKSTVFDPVVALTVTLFDLKMSDEQVRSKLDEDEAYFAAHCCRTIRAYDVDAHVTLDLSKMGADIVFFQQPIPMCANQRVFPVSRYALCCYIPYSIEYEDDNADKCRLMNELHWQPWFHDLLYLNITWNEDQAEYGRALSPWWRRAGKIEGLGHPYFDSLQTAEPRGAKGCIIYAPHFSFPTDKVKRPLTCSMFMETHEDILSYARSHREMKWLFKPHPALYSQLLQYGGWSKSEVDDYYHAWEEIGEKCYDGDYVHYFRNSRAMITDCCSFIIEYPVTGKPLIRLVRPKSEIRVRESVRPYVKTLYTADNVKDMQELFKIILENGEDPRKDERMNALRDLHVLGHNAGSSIVDYLARLITVTG